MSWELVTKLECSEFINMPETHFKDSWYDDVVELLKEEAGYDYLGETQAITDEAHDGDGKDVLFVKCPPIVSVQSVSVNGSAISSDRYKVYSQYVRLTHTTDDTLPEYFPEGVQNVLISYTAGYSTLPGGMKLAIKQAIAVVAQYHLRGASYIDPKYYTPMMSEPAANPFIPTVYLPGVVRRILRSGIKGRGGRFA